MDNHARLTGIILLVIGVILLIWPGTTLNTLCYLLGACLVGGGILEILIGAIGERFYGNIAGGIVSVLIGIVFMTRPDVIISFLPFMVGLMTSLGGAGFLAQTLITKETGYFAVMSIAGSAVAIVAGIILMVNAYATVKLLMIILGLVLVYFGVLRIIHS